MNRNWTSPRSDAPEKAAAMPPRSADGPAAVIPDPLYPLDPATPGGVYLCQVGQTVSCGACCGLYNIIAPHRETIQAMLASRTRRFRRVDRTVDAIADFGRQMEEATPPQPFSRFHHCPYLGLIEPDLSRVGCLLHPLAAGNGGVDFRGLSYYGGMACRVYFCPSCTRLPARLKQILRAVADDWYTYGLTITESDLLLDLLHAIEARMGERIDPSAVLGDPAREACFRRMFDLKIRWPYRSRPAGLIHYFFDSDPVARPNVALAEAHASPFRRLLRELSSHIPSRKTLQEAEGALCRFITELATGITGA